MKGCRVISWMVAGALFLGVGAAWAAGHQNAPSTKGPAPSACTTAQLKLKAAKTQLADLTAKLDTAKKTLEGCKSKGSASKCADEQKAVTTLQNQVNTKTDDVEKLQKGADTACAKK